MPIAISASRWMRRAGIAGTAVLAIAAGSLLASPDDVGAFFTGSGGATFSASAATIAPLVGGTASRTADGTATMQWDTPSLPARTSYTIERTVNGTTATIAPTVTDASGTTTFTDDLTLPAARAAAPFVLLSAGDGFSCGTTAHDGTYCWGYNRYGQFGDGSTTDRATPTRIPALDDKTVTALTAGDFHTCAATTDGAYCWGNNVYGQLGIGSSTNRLTPTRIAALDGKTVTALTASRFHTCAATSDGTYCWGNNAFGQLGDGSTTDRTAPTRIPALDGRTVTALAAYQLHTCAATSDGTYCWGDNTYGQLGDGSTTNRTTPTRVPALDGRTVTALAAGGYHTCVATSDGIYCWGDNADGQLGDGSTTTRVTPTLVTSLDDKVVTALTAGWYDTCAATNDGTYCWGYNGRGQLGDGSTTNRATPTRVAALDDKTIIALTADVNHSCAATDDGTYCWGLNADGQLGDGTTTSHTTPALVADGQRPVPTDPCAADWILTGTDRCTPGPDVAVSYRITHTVAGWAPAQALELSAAWGAS